MKYYWPLLTGLIIYTLLCFFWGRTGVYAQKELLTIRTELQQNLDELNRINRKLSDELYSLGSDPEMIIIQSRNLSYREKDELLLFVNLPDTGRSRIDAGKFLNTHWVDRAPDNLYKGLSILSFGLLSLLSFLIRKRESRKLHS